MNIHEYQAKQLLAKFAVPLLKGGVAYTRDEAMDVARKLVLIRTPQRELILRIGLPPAGPQILDRLHERHDARHVRKLGA